MAKKFKVTCPWIKRERAQHKRELWNPMSSQQQQAEEYARWLLARDAVEYYPDSLYVIWENIKVNGRAQKRFRGYCVRQLSNKSFKAEFPHWNFVQPDAVEHHDDQLVAA